MLASIGTVILIVAASVVGLLVLAFGGLLLLASRMTKAIENMMAEDATDPAKAWMQVAFGFINFRDPAYANAEEGCQAALKRDWDATGRDGVMQRARQLEQAMEANPAWNGVRLINMMRVAAGAKYVTPEESWEQALNAARKLQPAYTSWEEVGQAMLDGLDAMKGEWVVSAKQTLQGNIKQLKASNYRGVTYETLL